jgi:hypothetical protein
MDEEMAQDTKLSISLKFILVKMTANIVITEVGSLVHVVLSKEEKHVPYGETVPQNVQRYTRGVAQTEIVMTRFSCVPCD